MKKILVIIALGLLWCNTGFAESLADVAKVVVVVVRLADPVAVVIIEDPAREPVIAYIELLVPAPTTVLSLKFGILKVVVPFPAPHTSAILPKSPAYVVLLTALPSHCNQPLGVLL